MEEFNTIDRNEEAEITEKKSKFIAHLFYVETIEEAEKYIKEIKKKYYDAKHNCFAYAIETGDGGIAIKYNDDGEPSGTAGSPMLKVLLEKGITNVLIVITRYFGGTLLGTGGLVRAYTSATLKALDKVKIVKKTKGYEIQIQINYSDLEKVKYYLKNVNSRLLNVEYSENIKINVEIDKNTLKSVINPDSKKGFKIIKFDILKEKYI